MKKLLLLTKTLLVVALLCVGQNAWGQVTAFSQDFTDQGSTDPAVYGFNVTINSSLTSSPIVDGGVMKLYAGGNTSKADYGAECYSEFTPISGNYLVKLSCKWTTGSGLGTRGVSRLSLTDGDGKKALELSYAGTGTNKGTLSINGEAVTGAGDMAPQTGVTVTAELDMMTKKVVSLTVGDAYTMSASKDFMNVDMTSISRFYVKTNAKYNWEWNASVDDISISYYLGGDYYLKNKETGAYFAVGCSWGTQAMTNESGHRLGFAIQEGGKYHLNTYIYHDEKSSETRHFLNADFCDGNAQEWEVSPDGEGYYTLHNGTGYLTAGSVGEKITINAAGTGDPIKWQILTAAQRKAEIEARMASATSASGVDATFYITAPEFGYADLDDRAAWQGSPTFDGWNNKTSGRFWNGQKYNTNSFDVYQELSGLKPGAYKLTMKGFYRNGTTDDCNAILYANAFETPLVNIRSTKITAQDNDKGFTTSNGEYYVPNTQGEAAKAFYYGYYDNELYFVVGDAGTLRVGVKKTTGAENDWAVFDNFKLTYYGNSVPATIGSNGFTTFASPYPLDLTAATQSANGFTAYRASAVNDETVTFKDDVDQNVVANTGVLLHGTANAVVTIPVVASGSALADNALKVNAAGTTFDAAANTTYYGMNKGTDPLTFGTFDPSSVAIPANKAYLALTSIAAREVRVVFGDITGVANVEAAAEAKAKEGKFIENGKLVIVKNGQKFNAAGAKLYNY